MGCSCRVPQLLASEVLQSQVSLATMLYGLGASQSSTATWGSHLQLQMAGVSKAHLNVFWQQSYSIRCAAAQLHRAVAPGDALPLAELAIGSCSACVAHGPQRLLGLQHHLKAALLLCMWHKM